MSNNSSIDHEIISNMTKIGMESDEIRKHLKNGGDSYINALYMKMKGEKKALNSPIHPSFVPSILSSFGSPKGS